MLKYDEIIKKMSDSEKIHILCDIRNLSDKSYRIKGIPEIRTDSFESLGAGEFPPPDALANSWDIPLIRKVADVLAEKAVKKNTDLITVPSPRPRISPFRRAISEDPMLSHAVSREYLNAAEDAQISACIGGFGLNGDEIEFIDTEPDQRFLHEFLIRPYQQTLANKRCAALNVFCDSENEAYANANTAFADMVREHGGFGGALPVCGRVSPENSVSCIAKGQLFFEGSRVALETALSHYNKLNEAISAGTASAQELEEEIAAGRAISSEMLDAATDCLLDFVFSVKRKHSLSKEDADPLVGSRAVSESLVLLKNRKGLLPFTKNQKVCLIGDIAFAGEEGERQIDACADFLKAKGHRITGIVRGYELNKTRNEDLLEEAVSAAAEAEAVVIFLGIGEMRSKRTRFTKRISLPANQMALLDNLEASRNRIIAVLPSDELWDIEIPSYCAAIITMPWRTPYSGSVLADTLTGAWNPCGKLTDTVYTKTDERYRYHCQEKKRDGAKVGTFLGYRRYDTAEEKVEFPFGHGLSYTSFAYSKLSANENSVSVTVKNVGSYAGTEIVQIYAGKPDSDVLRPKKELVGFARVHLNAGERRTLQIPVKLPEVYSPERDRYMTESGDYVISVGASVSDIRLSQTVTADGSSLMPDGKKLSDYIHTKSNILTDNYKLEAKVSNMKKSVFNWIAGCALLMMALVLKMYWTAMESEPRFFVWFELLLCALAVWVFIAESIHKNELRRKDKALLDRANEALFENAEPIVQYDAASMFVQEFDRAEEVLPTESETRTEVGDTEYFENIDKERDFEKVVAEFEAFTCERGCKMHADDVRKIFAGLASSRLLVFKGLQTQDFRALMRLLSDYFETPLYVDVVNDSYANGESVLFRTDEQSNKIKTGALMAIESAGNVPQSIYLAGLSNVKCADLESYFAPYMNYINHPVGNASVRIVNEMMMESVHHVPRNLWFVLNLAEDESFADLPAEIAYAAVVDTPSFDACPESDTHTQVTPFGYYQLEYMKDRMSAVCAPSETLWKKVDLLEESVARNADFCIENKHWLGLESFVYAYIACGGNDYEAIDEAVAARLIVPMTLARKQAEADTDFESLIEKIFGEDHGEACKKLIRICG